MAGANLIPQRALIVCERFGAGVRAADVGAALAAGLTRAGAADPDICPLAGARGRGEGAAEVAAQLGEASFDARMLDSRAVILAVRSLAPKALAGSLAFEVATRARQSGVPAYAVTARTRLGSFDARVLDLQLVLEAATPAALRRAGRTLAGVI